MVRWEKGTAIENVPFGKDRVVRYVLSYTEGKVYMKVVGDAQLQDYHGKPRVKQEGNVVRFKAPRDTRPVLLKRIAQDPTIDPLDGRMTYKPFAHLKEVMR